MNKFLQCFYYNFALGFELKFLISFFFHYHFPVIILQFEFIEFDYGLLFFVCKVCLMICFDNNFMSLFIVGCCAYIYKLSLRCAEHALNVD